MISKSGLPLKLEKLILDNNVKNNKYDYLNFNDDDDDVRNNLIQNNNYGLNFFEQLKIIVCINNNLINLDYFKLNLSKLNIIINYIKNVKKLIKYQQWQDAKLMILRYYEMCILLLIKTKNIAISKNNIKIEKFLNEIIEHFTKEQIREDHDCYIYDRVFKKWGLFFYDKII